MTTINSLGTPDIVDYVRMLERRLARLERSTAGDPSTDPVVINALTITGLSLTTQSVIASEDNYRVMLRYTWNAISDDPSEYNKDSLDGYLTSWSLNGINYTAEQFTTQTNIDVGRFSSGQSVTFRVRGRTSKGTKGPYTSATTLTTTDVVAPFQPSTPVVTPYLGQLSIEWNGLDVASNPPPTDLRFVEVHLSSAGATFTPTIITLKGTLFRNGGTWIVTDLAYGTTYFARLVAVDTSGNRSPASTAGSAIPEQLVNGDVGPNAIATANIQNLAVNNAKIADLSVGKLTAGTLSANVTITSRLATALTGARAEMNSAGFQAYNNSGAQTFDVSSLTGNVTVTGRFRTGLSTGGVPYIDIQDTADRSTIFFFNSNNTNWAFINSSADANNIPRFGANTGIFIHDGVSARQRLFLANGNIELGAIRTDNNARIGYSYFANATAAFITRTNAGGVGAFGFSLSLGENQFTASRNNAAGSNTGGHLQLIDEGFYLSSLIGSNPAGAQIIGDQTNLFLQALSANIVQSEIILADNSNIFVTGRFVQDDGAARGALFVGTWNPGAATSFTINYGVTKTSRPQVLYSIHAASNPGDNRLSNFSTTGFTVTQANNITINLNYWGFRTS